MTVEDAAVIHQITDAILTSQVPPLRFLLLNLTASVNGAKYFLEGLDGGDLTSVSSQTIPAPSRLPLTRMARYGSTDTALSLFFVEPGGATSTRTSYTFSMDASGLFSCYVGSSAVQFVFVLEQLDNDVYVGYPSASKWSCRTQIERSY